LMILACVATTLHLRNEPIERLQIMIIRAI